MVDTIFALFIRELRTRFGDNRLGYFWALAEPVGQAAIMATLFTLVGRNSIAGVEVAVFLLSGIIPYKIYSKTISQSAFAIKANKTLLAYRQVEPIDPLLTRFVIELLTTIIVFILLMAVMGWFWGYEVVPDRPAEVLGALILMGLIALGFGLIMCSVVSYWDDASKVLGIVMTPMMLVSGVLYCAGMIPAQYWYLLSWNPAFHAIELIRESYFATYYAGFGSWMYLFEVLFFTWLLALSLYRINRVRFITL
ncbi:ABC transporter permease [Oceanobacter mangrovi]|uniref:ABC transporter permease n=1 Tax=Oceanobacter mangrovi TaxID=2862510 RepID=UPI001C8EF09D|nr:ABC transporter permease [Oceanobacter mangrovi]